MDAQEKKAIRPKWQLTWFAQERRPPSEISTNVSAKAAIRWAAVMPFSCYSLARAP